MMKLVHYFSYLLFAGLIVYGNNIHAQLDLAKESEQSVNAFYHPQIKSTLAFGDRDLQKKLRRQKTLKGFGIFNIAWGGLWFVAGIYAAAASSENRLLGITPALIGGGAATMGMIRVKKTNRKIKAIKEEIRVVASGVQLSFHF